MDLSNPIVVSSASGIPDTGGAVSIIAKDLSKEEMKGYKMKLFLTAVFLIAATAAHAGSTGFDVIHSKVVLNGKVCFVDHSHLGTGTARTKELALHKATQNWVSFTALEYGSDWASFGLATKRSMGCKRGLLRRYTCEVQGTPCKR